MNAATPMPPDDTVILEGAISIEAALKAGSRDIAELLIVEKTDNANVLRVERLATARGINVSRAPSPEIDARAAGKTHGGVIAIAGPRRFVGIDELKGGWIVMIDGVEDPYNFGSAVRSAYAAGAAGLVVRPRNWFTAAGLVARASAGASESIPTAIADTAEDAAEAFRRRGFTIACADETPDAVSLYDADLTRPLFLMIGGEKRGITRSFRDRADLTLRIPYGTPTSHSLGTAAATAVISFEILRQRTAGKPVQSSSRPSQNRGRPLLRPNRSRR